MNPRTIALVLLLPMAVPAEDFIEERRLEVPAAGLERLLVDVEAGSLEIVGQPDVNAVEVRATLWIEDHPRDIETTRRAVDGHVRLELDAAGDTARLVTRTRDPGAGYSLPHVDLVVTVPREIRLGIRDRSGYIVVRDIDDDVEIDDASGAIELSDVGGVVEITDESGRISVVRARGPLRIEDGSGSIDVEHIRDDVSIRDGSGSIAVAEVRGDVTIIDGSGSIRVDAVRGDVSIPQSGSGSVSIGKVAGLTSVE